MLGLLGLAEAWAELPQEQHLQMVWQPAMRSPERPVYLLPRKQPLELLA